MIPLLIGIFLFIFFVVAIVFSVRTWRGWHIAAMCVTYLAAMGLVVCASLTVRTHSVWRSQHADKERDLAVAQTEGFTREFGDPSMVESAEPPVNDIQAKLNRILLDRGRVWRQCKPDPTVPPAPSRVVLMTVPLLPTGEPDPATARPNNIAKDMVLYGFLESADASMPISFLGEFKALDVTDFNVTLEPTMPLDGLQVNQIRNPASSWSLFEMMPIDSHRAFSNDDTADKPLDDQPDPVFGNMAEEELRAIFAAALNLPPEHPAVTEFVDPYLVDGKTEDQAREKISVAPEETWWKLEFEKPHNERVDSNNLDPGLSGNFFDPEGYAEVTGLRAGGEGNTKGMAQFKKNDVGLFPYCHEIDKQQVDELVNSKTCRSLGPYYVRSLRDYEFAFHDIQEKFIKRNEDIARVQRDLAALRTTITKTQEQIAYRQQERARLQTDLEKFTLDRDKITELATTLAAQKAALQQELSQIYKKNLALNQRLAVMDAMLTEEINRRTADVATVQ